VLSPPDSRNGPSDIALLVDSPSMLVGVASFEENGFSADAAGEASLRRVLGGACHSMILLADMGFVKQAKTRIPELQFADQINTDHAKPIPHRSYGNWEPRRGNPLDRKAQKEIHGSGTFLPVSMSEIDVLSTIIARKRTRGNGCRIVPFSNTRKGNLG